MIHCLENGIIPHVINADGKDGYELEIPYEEEEEIDKTSTDAEEIKKCLHMGEILRQKCIKKNGNIRYANKNACRHCPNRNKCYQGKNEWKEIDFTKNTLEKPCKPWLESQKSKEIGTE
ncbi:MAG: hypothetical protein R3Y24_03280 [Eubacteriales bacterium]